MISDDPLSFPFSYVGFFSSELDALVHARDAAGVVDPRSSLSLPHLARLETGLPDPVCNEVERRNRQSKRMWCRKRKANRGREVTHI